MAPIAQRAPGTQDILPADQPYWEAIEAAAKDQAARFGFQRIETPIYETTDLFVRGVGEGTDIVTKEMYSFTDRGGRSLTLRPEGTAPIVRAYFDAGMQVEPQPVRLFYIGPFFRAERPQAGRFHQFRQFGIETIGDASPLLDVEAIVLGWHWFAGLDIDGVTFGRGHSVLFIERVAPQRGRLAIRDAPTSRSRGRAGSTPSPRTSCAR